MTDAAAQQTSPIDHQERIHLAMQAMGTGRHDLALGHLKGAVAERPDDAVAVYLLAAEHAQIGLFDRAVDGLKRALDLDPDLHTARFQLALLLSAFQQDADARAAFEPLATLPEIAAVGWYARGLLAVMDGDADDGRAAIRKGVELDRDNPALAADMSRVLTSLESGEAPDAEPTAGAKRPVNMGAYGRSDVG